MSSSPARRRDDAGIGNPSPNGGALHAERREREPMVAEGTGRDFKLSPTLEPLSDLKSDIVVLKQPVECGDAKAVTGIT